MRALIVEEGTSRAGLATARALGIAGWTVGVGSPIPSLTAASRWCTDSHVIPLPERGLKEFLAATRRAVRDGRYAVVIGSGDAEVFALSLGRETLGAVIPYPPHERVLAAFDKLELARVAARAGLETPWTVPATEEAMAALRGPAIMKARHHWLPGMGSAPPRHRTRVVFGRTGARIRAHQIRSRRGEPILQEMLTGELLAVCVVADHASRVVAAVHQRAERLWPPQIGISTRARTVEPDAQLTRGVSALIRELEWFGMAEIQFLVPSDGRPRIIDFNGRPYGSLALAVQAGVNLPAMAAAMALGLEPPDHSEARIGTRYHWLEGDLRRAFEQGRMGGLGRDIADSLRWAPGAVHSIWNVTDPMPAFRHVGRLAGYGWRKLFPPRTAGRKVLPVGETAA
jgi:predicted ATP-grasp superfamily ATP-dependent carboligase